MNKTKLELGDSLDEDMFIHPAQKLWNVWHRDDGAK